MENKNKVYQTPSQSIPKAYLRESIPSSDFENFRVRLQDLLISINPSETEDHNKIWVIRFLNDTFYGENEYRANTYQNTDLAIYTDMHLPSQRPVVLFEFKGPGRPDMISHNNFCKKSFCELVLYYLREEIRNRNTDIKHLVITDCYQYFIFEKKLFYELFAKNSAFVNRVLEADQRGGDNTEYIYEKIIKPEIERVSQRIRYTYVDLNELKLIVRNKEKSAKSKKLAAVYKLFSPIYLLKKPFSSDHNKLNNGFYKELLYIMGVEEVVEKETHKIKRLKTNRQQYSLLEQAYDKLQDYDGVTTEEERFEAALGLVLVWIDRILFLKLLESQLIDFNKDNRVRFLDSEHIPGYDELFDLFRKVLAKPEEAREENICRRFPYAPYLNSSLFELSPLEQKYFSIGGIRLGSIEIYTGTKVKGLDGSRLKGQLSTLEYLFRFLDAYDFGGNTENADNLVRQEKKTIINASVLGLIFEKINGYKDGSFFTPGYITQYICEQTIKKAVVDKFNEVKGWNCESYDDLLETIDYRGAENRNEANQIVNSIRICDPAVGSGHFLVSALNQIIAIKSELGILQDHSDHPKRIKDYDIRIEDDELVVSDEDGEIFKYDPASTTSQRIQETLFEEKRTIIENCLFGVDLNPKSVEICQLRLWIELLKNAYYYRNEQGERRLQTLPNIDINIKQGNSLLSNFHVSAGEKIGKIKKFSEKIKDYKKLVREYKNCSNKDNKNNVKKSISLIKSWLIGGMQYDIFEDNTKLVQDFLTNAQVLEWMIEFPEVLDENGVFLGFDVIIGNPPYISLEQLKNDAKAYAKMHHKGDIEKKTYETLQPRGDIYTLFVERGLHLLRKGGRLSYILPNKWTKVMYGKPLRQLFLSQNLTDIVDFGDYQIFDDATTYTCIIEMTKEDSKGKIRISQMSRVQAETLSMDAEERKEIFQTKEMDDGIWVISSLANFHQVKRLQELFGTLSDYVGGECYRGLLTGLSKAFNIDEETFQSLKNTPGASDILRPFMQGRGQQAFGKPSIGSYLVFVPKGFTKQKMGTSATESEAWQWFSKQYPGIATWLLPFEKAAKSRSDKGDYWWELRACDYYDKFEKPKVFYQAFQTKPCFVYDESGTYCNNSMFFLSTKDKSLLSYLCSDLGWWLITEFCPRIQNGAQLIWDNFSQIPVPSELPKELQKFAEIMMTAVAEDNSQFCEQTKKELNVFLESYLLDKCY